MARNQACRQAVDKGIVEHLEGVHLAASGCRHAQQVAARLAHPGVGHRRVADVLAEPLVGGPDLGLHAYLYARSRAGDEWRKAVASVADDMHRVPLGVGLGAASGHGGDEGDGVEATLAVGMCGVFLCRRSAVAEVPSVGRAAAGVAEVHRVGGAARRRRNEFGHGEVVGDIETEEGVVAVAGQVAVAPGIGGGGEPLGAAAGTANRLVERGQTVEARRAAVHVVAAAARLAGVVGLAEEGGVLQLVGVGIDAHQVEILPVRGVHPCVGGGLHARGAHGVPLDVGVAHKVAAPARQVDPVADVGRKGRGREVDASGSAENGAPHTVAQVGQHAQQEHAAVVDAVARVVDEPAVAHGLGLAEEEHLVAFAGADEVELVVRPQAHEGRRHQAVAVVGYFAHESVGRPAAVACLPSTLGGGEVGAGGAAANQEVVARIHVDGVHGIVAAAAQVGAPKQGAQVVVQFEYHSVLARRRHGLHTARGGGEVDAHRGAAHVDVVQVVGDEFAAGAVAIVVVQRVVAHHQHIVVQVETVAEIQSVVAAAADVGGGLQLAAVGAQAAHKEVAAGGIAYDTRFVVNLLSSAMPVLEGSGGGREVGRPGGAEDYQLVEGVHKQAVGHIRRAAAQIRGVEALLPEGVELEDAHVHAAANGVLIGAQRGGVALAEHQSGGVDVLLRVVGRRGAPVVGRAAGVGREDQHRVDHQLATAVVVAKLNPHLPHRFPGSRFPRSVLRLHLAPLHAPTACNLLSSPVNHLIHIRFQFNNVPHAGSHHKVALAAHADRLDALVGQADGRGIGFGIDYEVVFQRFAAAIHLQRHAGVEPIVARRGETAHVRTPAARVVAEVVVAVSLLAVQACGEGGGGPEEVHLVRMASHATAGTLRRLRPTGVPGGLAQRHGDAIALQKQRRIVQLHSIVHTRIPLSEVLHKQHRRARTQRIPFVAGKGEHVDNQHCRQHQPSSYANKRVHIYNIFCKCKNTSFF